jgi:glycerophosphoryl diester phosphodiesterase
MNQLFTTIALSFLLWTSIMPVNAAAAQDSSLPLLTYGHRGDSHSYPANTIASIESAFEKVDGAEIDIRLTSDGHLVIFHDDTLESLTKAQLSRLPSRLQNVPLETLTLTQLQLVTLEGGKKIPLLSDALDVLAKREFDDKGLLIELKITSHVTAKKRMYAALTSLFSQAKYSNLLYRISFISFNKHILDLIAASPDVFHAAKTFLVVTSDAIEEPKTWAQNLKMVQNFSGMDLESNVNLLKKDHQGLTFADHLRANKKNIITWINRKKRTDGILFKLISDEIGVDIFTSDLPLEVWSSDLYHQRAMELSTAASLHIDSSKLFFYDDGNKKIVSSTLIP